VIRPGCMFAPHNVLLKRFVFPRNRTFCYSDATQRDDRTRLSSVISASLLYLPKSLPVLSNLMVAVRLSTPCAGFVFSIINSHRFTCMGKLCVHPVVPEDDVNKRRRNAYGLRKAIKCRDAFGKYRRYIRLKVTR
jgi:hypothetical protein